MCLDFNKTCTVPLIPLYVDWRPLYVVWSTLFARPIIGRICFGLVPAQRRWHGRSGGSRQSAGCLMVEPVR